MTYYDLRELSTALGNVRDVSVPGERASTAPEGRRRSSWCVCGTLITPETVTPTDVLFAVASHNRTARHEEWRRIMGR